MSVSAFRIRGMSRLSRRPRMLLGMIPRMGYYAVVLFSIVSFVIGKQDSNTTLADAVEKESSKIQNILPVETYQNTTSNVNRSRSNVNRISIQDASEQTQYPFEESFNDEIDNGGVKLAGSDQSTEFNRELNDIVLTRVDLKRDLAISPTKENITFWVGSPISGWLWTAGMSTMVFTELLKQEINKNPDILPDYNLNLIHIDLACNKDFGLKHIWRALLFEPLFAYNPNVGEVARILYERMVYPSSFGVSLTSTSDYWTLSDVPYAAGYTSAELASWEAQLESWGVGKTLRKEVEGVLGGSFSNGIHAFFGDCSPSGMTTPSYMGKSAFRLPHMQMFSNMEDFLDRTKYPTMHTTYPTEAWLWQLRALPSLFKAESASTKSYFSMVFDGDKEGVARRFVDIMFRSELPEFGKVFDLVGPDISLLLGTRSEIIPRGYINYRDHCLLNGQNKLDRMQAMVLDFKRGYDIASSMHPDTIGSINAVPGRKMPILFLVYSWYAEDIAKLTCLFWKFGVRNVFFFYEEWVGYTWLTYQSWRDNVKDYIPECSHENMVAMASYYMTANPQYTRALGDLPRVDPTTGQPINRLTCAPDMTAAEFYYEASRRSMPVAGTFSVNVTIPGTNTTETKDVTIPAPGAPWFQSDSDDAIRAKQGSSRTISTPYGFDFYGETMVAANAVCWMALAYHQLLYDLNPATGKHDIPSSKQLIEVTSPSLRQSPMEGVTYTVNGVTYQDPFRVPYSEGAWDTVMQNLVRNEIYGPLGKQSFRDLPDPNKSGATSSTACAFNEQVATSTTAAPTTNAPTTNAPTTNAVPAATTIKSFGPIFPFVTLQHQPLFLIHNQKQFRLGPFLSSRDMDRISRIKFYSHFRWEHWETWGDKSSRSDINIGACAGSVQHTFVRSSRRKLEAAESSSTDHDDTATNSHHTSSPREDAHHNYRDSDDILDHHHHVVGEPDVNHRNLASISIMSVHNETMKAIDGRSGQSLYFSRENTGNAATLEGLTYCMEIEIDLMDAEVSDPIITQTISSTKLAQFVTHYNSLKLEMHSRNTDEWETMDINKRRDKDWIPIAIHKAGYKVAGGNQVSTSYIQNWEALTLPLDKLNASGKGKQYTAASTTNVTATTTTSSVASGGSSGAPSSGGTTETKTILRAYVPLTIHMVESGSLALDNNPVEYNDAYVYKLRSPILGGGPGSHKWNALDDPSQPALHNKLIDPASKKTGFLSCQGKVFDWLSASCVECPANQAFKDGRCQCGVGFSALRVPTLTELKSYANFGSSGFGISSDGSFDQNFVSVSYYEELKASLDINKMVPDEDCKACPLNHYKNQIGTISECVRCEEGTFAVTQGSEACTTCPIGHTVQVKTLAKLEAESVAAAAGALSQTKSATNNSTRTLSMSEQKRGNSPHTSSNPHGSSNPHTSNEDREFAADSGGISLWTLRARGRSVALEGRLSLGERMMARDLGKDGKGWQKTVLVSPEWDGWPKFASGNEISSNRGIPKSRGIPNKSAEVSADRRLLRSIDDNSSYGSYKKNTKIHHNRNSIVSHEIVSSFQWSSRGLITSYTTIMDVCRPCQPGTFSPQLGSACITTPRGTFSDSPGADKSADCPIGSYQDEVGQASCKECPGGKSTLSTGSIYITQCLCPAGSYAPCLPGKGKLNELYEPFGYVGGNRPASTDMLSGLALANCDAMVQSPKCLPCPKGATCHGLATDLSILLRTGYKGSGGFTEPPTLQEAQDMRNKVGKCELLRVEQVARGLQLPTELESLLRGGNATGIADRKLLAGDDTEGIRNQISGLMPGPDSGSLMLHDGGSSLTALGVHDQTVDARSLQDLHYNSITAERLLNLDGNSTATTQSGTLSGSSTGDVLMNPSFCVHTPPVPDIGFWSSMGSVYDVYNCYSRKRCPGVFPDVCSNPSAGYGMVCAECRSEHFWTGNDKQCEECGTAAGMIGVVFTVLFFSTIWCVVWIGSCPLVPGTNFGIEEVYARIVMTKITTTVSLLLGNLQTYWIIWKILGAHMERTGENSQLFIIMDLMGEPWNAFLKTTQGLSKFQCIDAEVTTKEAFIIDMAFKNSSPMIPFLIVLTNFYIVKKIIQRPRRLDFVMSYICCCIRARVQKKTILKENRTDVDKSQKRHFQISPIYVPRFIYGLSLIMSLFETFSISIAYNAIAISRSESHPNNNGKSMTDLPSILIGSTQYNTILIMSLSAAMFWCGGYLFIMLLLFRRASVASKVKSKLARILLPHFARFEDKWHFYGLVLVCRRFLFVLCLFANPYRVSLTCFQTVLVVSVIINLKCRPFRFDAMLKSDTIPMLFQIIVCFALNLESETTGISEGVVSAVVLVVSTAHILAFMWIFFALYEFYCFYTRVLTRAAIVEEKRFQELVVRAARSVELGEDALSTITNKQELMEIDNDMGTSSKISNSLNKFLMTSISKSPTTNGRGSVNTGSSVSTVRKLNMSMDSDNIYYNDGSHNTIAAEENDTALHSFLRGIQDYCHRQCLGNLTTEDYHITRNSLPVDYGMLLPPDDYYYGHHEPTKAILIARRSNEGFLNEGHHSSPGHVDTMTDNITDNTVSNREMNLIPGSGSKQRDTKFMQQQVLAEVQEDLDEQESGIRIRQDPPDVVISAMAVLIAAAHRWNDYVSHEIDGQNRQSISMKLGASTSGATTTIAPITLPPAMIAPPIITRNSSGIASSTQILGSSSRPGSNSRPTDHATIRKSVSNVLNTSMKKIVPYSDPVITSQKGELIDMMMATDDMNDGEHKMENLEETAGEKPKEQDSTQEEPTGSEKNPAESNAEKPSGEGIPEDDSKGKSVDNSKVEPIDSNEIYEKDDPFDSPTPARDNYTPPADTIGDSSTPPQDTTQRGTNSISLFDDPPAPTEPASHSYLIDVTAPDSSGQEITALESSGPAKDGGRKTGGLNFGPSSSVDDDDEVMQQILGLEYRAHAKVIIACMSDQGIEAMQKVLEHLVTTKTLRPELMVKPETGKSKSWIRRTIEGGIDAILGVKQDQHWYDDKRKSSKQAKQAKQRGSSPGSSIGGSPGATPPAGKSARQVARSGDHSSGGLPRVGVETKDSKQKHPLGVMDPQPGGILKKQSMIDDLGSSQVSTIFDDGLKISIDGGGEKKKEKKKIAFGETQTSMYTILTTTDSVEEEDPSLAHSRFIRKDCLDSKEARKRAKMLYMEHRKNAEQMHRRNREILLGVSQGRKQGVGAGDGNEFVTLRSSQQKIKGLRQS